MLKSGWALMQFRKNSSKIQPTELLQGCCSYRKKVFNEYEFDERLRGHAVREDIDFSFRVSRKYKLIYTPFAKLYHKSSSEGRESEELYYRKYIYNHYYIFRKNMGGSLINWFCFWWSEIGSMLGIIMISIKRYNIFPLKGALKGYLFILKDFFCKS
jgi:GT2 family glycosyltransferase